MPVFDYVSSPVSRMCISAAQDVCFCGAPCRCVRPGIPGFDASAKHGGTTTPLHIVMLSLAGVRVFVCLEICEWQIFHRFFVWCTDKFQVHMLMVFRVLCSFPLGVKVIMTIAGLRFHS